MDVVSGVLLEDYVAIPTAVIERLSNGWSIIATVTQCGNDACFVPAVACCKRSTGEQQTNKRLHGVALEGGHSSNNGRFLIAVPWKQVEYSETLTLTLIIFLIIFILHREVRETGQPCSHPALRDILGLFRHFSKLGENGPVSYALFFLSHDSL